MQTQITEFINTNKYAYQQIYEKLLKMNEQSEQDFQNIVELNGKIPENMSDSDKSDFGKLVTNIENKLRLYSSEFEFLNNQINNFERNTYSFTDSIGVVKGGVMILKNNLIQASNEQLVVLHGGFTHLKEVLGNIENLLNELKRAGGVHSLESDKIQALVYKVLKDEFKNIEHEIVSGLPKFTRRDCEEMISYHLGQLNLNSTDNSASMATLKKELTNTINDISIQVTQLGNLISGIHLDNSKKKTEFKDIKQKLEDDLDDLKYELSSKFKVIDNSLNSGIKRYV